LSPASQALANALADYFTAVELHALVANTELAADPTIWQEDRQTTAEAIVRAAQTHGREELVRQRATLRHPEAFPASQPSDPLPLDLSWNAVESGTATAQGGVLSSTGQPMPRSAQRYVNLGFASRSNPAQPLEAIWPLEPERRYYFWVEIGALLAGSIATAQTEIDLSALPDDAVLHVALFGFPDELALTAGQDLGRLRLQPDGALLVDQQPIRPPRTAEDMLAKRLFFPVQTPAQAGTYRLRCHIYYQQVLLQSHLVTAVVSPLPTPQKEPPALRATADFILSKSLSSAHLAQMPTHKLSIMMNDNGGGTHGFRFFGQGEFKNDVTLDAGELQNLLNLARGALRRAAWGDDQPYAPGKTYRYDYDGQVDLQQTFGDLLLCAIRGYRFYDALINRLAGDGDKAWALADQMREPGEIQLASKVSARLLVPAALFYDHPLDTGLKASDYRLCQTFATAVQNNIPLLSTPCFQGNCPHHGEDDVIC
ncbi:MAG: hypothetical protein KDD89_14590, partial [Anaerolineales bacterium]|nr:hypothetical protein [Anaerolineales bacterium]